MVEVVGIQYQLFRVGEDAILAKYFSKNLIRIIITFKANFYFKQRKRFNYLLFKFFGQIPDWKFPYKKSFHPVCIHDFQEPKNIILRNCDDDVESGTEIFKFHQALSCKCSVCKSSEASCEGIKEKETNFHPQLIW